MPRWLVIALLIVFAIHFVAFLRLALKRGDRYYHLLSLTFLLLVLSFAGRLWLADLAFAGIPLFWFPRIAAWICTALVIFVAVRRRLRARRALCQD